MKLLSFFTSFFFLVATKANLDCDNNVQNNCITFTISSGTGCEWMCNYCSNQLGTNNYYFTDNVCTYESGIGCVGNPISGKSYTCCSA